MDYIPDYFQDAPIGAIHESRCTPSMSPFGSGIVIDAPQKIQLNGADHAVIPICGRYQLPAVQAMGAPPLVIEVVRRKDGTRLQAALGPSPDELDEPDVPEPGDIEPLTDEDLKDTVTIGIFHVDAQAWIDAPLLEGEFELRVHFAQQESNSVAITISP